MAVVAFSTQFLCSHICRVALIALQLGMRSSQCKLGIARMIKRSGLPRCAVMALVTVDIHAARMRILSAMTTLTIFRNRVLHAPTGVTTSAVRLRMCAKQGKARFLGVIKLGSCPAGSGMTLRTTASTRATMHIIRCMTRCALLRRVLVMILQMACGAWHFSMLIG